LDPRNLDEIKRWSGQVSETQKEYAPQAETWLGETGNAQCGGEPGISNSFVGSLWWIDQLGLGAKLGQKVMVRQTLTGSDYGLIDYETMIPMPGYWSSLIWKKLMGTRVYSLGDDWINPYIRLYAHSTPAGERFPVGSITLLVINLHKEKTVTILLPETEHIQKKIFSLSTDDIYGSDIYLNRNHLTFESGKIPDLLSLGEAKDRNLKELSIPPTSFTFVVLHN
jgi:heparanase 1